MKFDVLYNFISPVTGRILCDYNHVLVGDINGIAIPSMNIPIDVLPDLTLNQFWIGDVNNRPIECIVDIPICYAATASFLSSFYDNGTDGIGATLTIPGTFLLIDNTILTLGALVLVKDQLLSYENGVYVYSNQTAFFATLTRADFYDAIQEIRAGDSVSVQYGVTNALSTWVQIESVNIIGTDAINYIGPMGPIGPKGPKGQKGDKGDTGPRGGGGGTGGGDGFLSGLFGGILGGAGIGIISNLGPPLNLQDVPTKNPGAETVSGKTTVFMDTNIDLVGGRLENIAQSPEADFDAVSAKFVWDLLNDNVEIKWEKFY